MNDGQITIDLFELCQSKNSQRLKEEFLDAIDKDIELDAKDVDVIPSIILQTMLAASKQWRIGQKTISISNLTDAVCRDIHMLGLEKEPLFAEVMK
jgi:anti-anti-sigma regulatory factor